jgi:hypothetical protein
MHLLKIKIIIYRANQFSDLSQMVVIVTKFALGSSYTSRIPHLEGEEVFGSTKQRQNLPFGSKDDFHTWGATR